MMDIRDKLRQFESISNLPSQKSKNRMLKQKVRGLGEEVSNDFGTCLRIRTDYPTSHCHGKISLDTFREVDSSIFSWIGNDSSFNDVDFSQTIFIDTETTGLAGGAGTVPFLVGVGYFQDNQFILDQYFMRDYDEERALLSFVADYIRPEIPLITYNGKGYDAHVLSSRWTLSRMPVNILTAPHLDLLYPVRRLWRRRLSDCSLGHVETMILAFQRVGDVPGFLIPSLFFDFLRSGDFKLLEPVFAHNRWDILTLVCLGGLIGHIFQDPIHTLNHPADFFSLGRAMDRLGKNKIAIQCYREALEAVQLENNWLEIARHLGFILKREKRWDEAVDIWQSILERHPGQIEVYEELAKYYEHHVNVYDKAIEMVTRALDRIQIVRELQDAYSASFWEKSLIYRMKRLERKNTRG